MQEFFLNFTKIVEQNAKVYWSIILGIVSCLILFVIEAFHVQNMIAALNSTDQQVLPAAIEPVTQRYAWARAALILLSIVWANWEYRKTKQALGL
ncbi:hypothetical protein [Acinetobacter towneri]|uniref:Uncharacterized protein n=1 Tax=Acinetobacter towneri TaxID=202956 RepID=A0AAP9KJ13_9GAMM|nr:hypothetical protein [Acinetobacter towneri]QGM26910.1 hypothetical protein GJD93_04020 [Acinetobacter towneri]